MSEGDTAVSAVMDTNPNAENEVLETIAAFLGISREELGSLGGDHVITDHIMAKARDFNELQSSNIKLHATIDEMKVLCSKKVDFLKSKVDSLTKNEESVKETEVRLQEQVSQLAAENKMALDKLGNAQSELQNVQEQKEGIMASKQDVIKLLDEKVSELEASKRETDELLKENKELRQRILEVENEAQNYKCRELSNKSEMEVIKQQVTLLTKSNEWLERDITMKTEQFIKYRKENDTELQRSLQELASIKSEFQAEKSSREFLSSKNNELSQDLQAKLLDFKKLSDSLSVERQEFSREMSLKQKLIDLLEEQVDSLQKEIRLAKESQALDSDEKDSSSLKRTGLESELADMKRKLEASEHECLRLEAVVREVLGEGSDEKAYSSSPRDLSLSKVYGDLGVLKKQLIKERYQKESLQRQVESFIVELEYKVPFINSLKDRTSALEKELSDAALLLEHTSNEKEKISRELEAASGKLKQYESNISTLVRQRSDLARQVQFLLVNVSVHNDSRGPLTEEETAFIRRLIENEVTSDDSDSQRVITERLVEFKDIATLQERNTELLKTVRNLAANLEEEERKADKKIDSLESETINEAKEAIVILQEYNAKLESRMEVILKERDAYKTILAEKEDAKHGTLSASFDSKNNDRESLIKDLEVRLANLSAETSKNIQMLNEEIQSLLKAKTDVSIRLEKERSSKTLAEERLKLLQSTLDMAKKENAELLKRSHELQDNIANQEVKSSETMNKYISCKSQLSIFQSKAGHLGAEKSLLQASNDSMRSSLEKTVEEKNSLKVVITQLQTLQSERENLLRDTHTSYKEKLDRLECHLEKLTSAIESKDEELKAVEQSRNSQVIWYQEKLDAMGNQARQLREEITEKSSLVTQLEAKVKDLTKRLEETEVRVTSKSPESVTALNSSSEAEMRHNLEKLTLQLNDAYSQIEQYKELSSAAEESWQSIRSEFDRAKGEFDFDVKKLLSEKSDQEREVSRLKEKIDFLNNTYAAEKNRSEEEKHELSKKIFSLEGKQYTLDTLKSEFEQKISELKSDLEQQTAYANVAQSNYEEELQRHAEVSRTIRQLRAEVETDRLKIKDLEVSEQRARELLAANEKNWFEQKAEYEKDLEAHQSRIEDLSSQNKLLFNQIELFSNGKREADVESHFESRELLTNLRRERDVLETKLTVSRREEKVLRQRQLALENDLSEMRKKALKSQANDYDQTALAKQHAEILEQLNQMNLLRESNITLRNAANEAQEKNADLQKELTHLQSKVIPLECEAENCRRSIMEKDQEIQVLRDETERWKARSHDILRRQEKIDPEEFKNLEQQVVSLKDQLEERVRENADLEDRFSRLKKQAHEKLNASKIAQANLTAEMSDLTSTKANLEEALKKEQAKVMDLERLLSEKSSDSASIDNLRIELEEAIQKAEEMESKLGETTSDSERLIHQLNEEIASLKQKLETLKEKSNGSLEVNQGGQDLSSIVDSMKRAFEEEKTSLVRDLKQEYNEKLEEEKAKLKSQSLASEDLSELKRKWEETQEETVQNRIKNAEENLKKRIRMPTEERISKVLEKRKAELEEEYEAKMKQISSQPNETSSDTKEELKKELEKEFEAKYEELLGSVKKKAFDEGKQQAAMKSTLLERKIAKLEAQLNKASQSPTEPLAPVAVNGLPSKIDERNGANLGATQFPVPGEKVLKLAEKPNFQFQSSPASNPFTSGLTTTNNAFAMKPAFTFSVNSSKSKVDPSLDADNSNQHTEGENSSAQSHEQQQTEDDAGSGAQNMESEDSNQTMGEGSPQKRPADSHFSDGTAPKREKQESA